MSAKCERCGVELYVMPNREKQEPGGPEHTDARCADRLAGKLREAEEERDAANARAARAWEKQRGQILALEASLKTARDSARMGWESARCLAIELSAGTGKRSATEHAADEALAALAAPGLASRADKEGAGT